MESLAFDVADEHLKASKQATSSAKDSETKMAALQATTDERLEKLEKYKQTKAKADELKVGLNETTEKMAEELLDARTQTRRLKEELLRKTEEAEELQLMLDLAREDVDHQYFHCQSSW
jgi:glutamate-1-semialdehyde aminotransferase